MRDCESKGKSNFLIIPEKLNRPGGSIQAFISHPDKGVSSLLCSLIL